MTFKDKGKQCKKPESKYKIIYHDDFKYVFSNCNIY